MSIGKDDCPVNSRNWSGRPTTHTLNTRSVATTSILTIPNNNVSYRDEYPRSRAVLNKSSLLPGVANYALVNWRRGLVGSD
jgi:hypothetical protein